MSHTNAQTASMEFTNTLEFNSMSIMKDDPKILCPNSCDEGHECNHNLGICEPCQIGTRSMKGWNKCKPCPAGYFCNSTGISKLINFECPVGYYCLEGAITIQSCSPGFHCYAKSSISDPNDGINGEICPIGHECPKGESVLCNKGYYADVEGLSKCKMCPHGFFCNVGCESPKECKPGYICPARIGENDMEICPIGTYTDDNINCKHCSGGKYCAHEGLIKEDGECNEGYYCKYGAFTMFGNISLSNMYYDEIISPVEGGICPKGYYCPLGTEDPIPCPISTYNDVNGATSEEFCKQCTPGFYCDVLGAEKVSGKCKKGYYCPIGSHKAIQRICPKGYYCPANSEKPIKCKKGSYNNKTGMDKCVECSKGSKCGKEGMETYEKCDLGHYCGVGTINPIECPMGTFGNLTNLKSEDECTPCTTSWACTSKGLSQPDAKCEAGYYCINGSTTTTPKDSLCPVGHYCLVGTEKPIPCPIGKFMNVSGAKRLEDCIECTAGKYCDTLGAIEESGECLGGYYCPHSSTSAIEKICDERHFCPPGSAKPIPCKSGYESEEGMEECTACPAGYRCNVTGKVDCGKGLYCPSGTPMNGQEKCPVGKYYSDMNGKSIDDCVACDGGKACTEEGLGSPNRDCQKGYYCFSGAITTTPTDGITGDICPIGSYCPAKSSKPELCILGTFQDNIGSHKCQLCDIGKCCRSTGMTLPGNCDSGFYSDKEGSVMGKKCPIHYYCENGTKFSCKKSENEYCWDEGFGKSDIVICNKGYYISNDKRSAIECEKGHKCNNGKMKECDAGFYQDLKGQDSCKKCDIWHYCPNKKMENPIPCDKGMYCDKMQLKNETMCPRGWYCPHISTGSSNDTEKKLCPEHKMCPSGSKKPIKCTYRMHCPKPGMWKGKECDDGKECKDGKQLDCPEGYSCKGGFKKPCEKKYFCKNGFMNICPNKYYCDEKGMKESNIKPCDVGFYCKNGEKISCPERKICNEVKLDSPKDCKSPVGHTYQDKRYFCRVGDYMTSHECDRGFYCQKSTDYTCPSGYVCWQRFMGDVEGIEQYLCPSGYNCFVSQHSLEPILSLTSEKGGRKPTPCPDNYFCPKGSSNLWSTECPKNKLCHEMASKPRDCPLSTNDDVKVSCETGMPVISYKKFPKLYQFLVLLLICVGWIVYYVYGKKSRRFVNTGAAVNTLASLEAYFLIILIIILSYQVFFVNIFNTKTLLIDHIL